MLLNKRQRYELATWCNIHASIDLTFKQTEYIWAYKLRELEDINVGFGVTHGKTKKTGNKKEEEAWRNLPQPGKKFHFSFQSDIFVSNEAEGESKQYFRVKAAREKSGIYLRRREYIGRYRGNVMEVIFLSFNQWWRDSSQS